MMYKTTIAEKRLETLLALSLELEGSDPNKSRYFANQALAIAQKIRSDIWEVRSNLRIGACYLAMNDYTSALRFIEKANESAEKHGFIKELAISFGNLAIIYNAIGDYSKSSEYDFRSLKFFEQLGDKNQIGVSLGNIGADFIIQGNYEKGLEYLYKSLEIAQALNDQPGIAYQYNNIAGVYFESFKDYQQALNFYFKSLATNQKIGNKYQEALNLLNIGFTYLEMKNYENAFNFAQKALDIFSKLNSPIMLAGCKMLLADYYSSVGDFELAIEYSLSALEIGKKQNSLETIRSAANILESIYLKKGDYKNAFDYIKTEFNAKDSLNYQQSKKELFKLEIQYSQEKVEKARLIRQQKKNYLIGLIFIILVSVTTIVILINSRQKIRVKNTLLEKESIEKELDFKNKELSINVMALVKKEEMLMDISNKLVQIEKIAISEETKVAIGNIYNELRKSTEDKILNEFSVRFQEVHSGFYEALLQKFPDLTQNELKLCAYLRLNMSTKDISELTGTSKLTLENSRYRLRKKLGITNSEINLVTFLLQI